MIRQCWDGARDKRLTASECYATLSTAHAQLSTGEYDIFFSHRWANKPFLSHLHHLLCEHGYRVWYVRPQSRTTYNAIISLVCSLLSLSLSISPHTSLIGPQVRR